MQTNTFERTSHNKCYTTNLLHNAKKSHVATQIPDDTQNVEMGKSSYS